MIWPGAKALRQILNGPGSVWSIVTTNDTKLKSTDGRTNILLLGIGDPSHDGPNLSDTIILVSIDINTYDVALISIPRDVWIPSLKEKINSAYAVGETKQKGGGFILVKASASEILNVPIHYAARINFSGFKKAIDLVGGIDINVENTFDDFEYPIDGKENDLCNNDPEYKCRYEHLHFDRGMQHMDGQTALKFVRSRHAEGIEGTDFARSKRQQKVLLALKEKIVSPEIMFSPGKVPQILEIFGSSIDSDIDLSDTPKFIKLFTKVESSKIRSFLLDLGDKTASREGLLINPLPDEYNGAWILVPKNGTWEEIQQKLHDFLKTKAQ
jgi:LCP family protein required for cell wall assembly